MTDTQTASPSGANPGSSRLSGLRAWAPSGAQTAFVAIGLLAASNVALWMKLEQVQKARAVTVVAVREMTQSYLTKISAGNISPQEASVRAQTFVAVAQEEIKRLVPDKGSLVLARECVLAGEQNDITRALQATTESKLSQVTGGLSAVVGPVAASPLALQLGQPPSAVPTAPGAAAPSAFASTLIGGH